MAQDTVDGRRLSPGAALNRFDPPEGFHIDNAPADDWRARFGFQVGNVHLLIRPESVSEVLEKGPVYPIPNTPTWLLGLMNLRGNLIPVFDLHQLLETSHEGRRKQMMLVLDKGVEAGAIVIDGLPQALSAIPRLQRLPPVPSALRNHTHEAFAKDGTVWLEFDHWSFFRSVAKQFAT
jgi:chemotaxis signal transduction protein